MYLSLAMWAFYSSNCEIRVNIIYTPNTIWRTYVILPAGRQIVIYYLENSRFFDLKYTG